MDCSAACPGRGSSTPEGPAGEGTPPPALRSQPLRSFSQFVCSNWRRFLVALLSLRQSHRPRKLSPPIRAREKRVISKALTEWAEYRPRRLRPIFPLSSAVFSAGWELRQFSTQLVISMFSMACGTAGRVPVRKRDCYAERSANVPTCPPPRRSSRPTPHRRSMEARHSEKQRTSTR